MTLNLVIAPASPARCALTLILVLRRIAELEKLLWQIDTGRCWATHGTFRQFEHEHDRLELAAALLDAALAYHQAADRYLNAPPL